MGETNGWDFLLGDASAGNGGEPGTWDWAFARARAMPDKTAETQLAQLPGSITPWELRGSTGVQLDPIGNLKTGARQAGEEAKENAKKAGKNTFEFMKSLWDTGAHNTLNKGFQTPLIFMPYIMEEYELEQSKKRPKT
jgi:hypothetical protein